MKLKLLWHRGHSDLYTLCERGITFHCWDTTTSIQVGGFSATGESTTPKAVSEDTTEWNVFVPFGQVSYLNFHSGHDVVVLITERGPLEIYAGWNVGEVCSHEVLYLTDGTTFEVDHNEPVPVMADDFVKKVIKDWLDIFNNG